MCYYDPQIKKHNTGFLPVIASMTAFARCSEEASWGSMTWEIRSVNHRYFEMATRLPEPFRQVEKMVRECIQKFISRGKVDATLKFQPGEDVPFDIVVNVSLAEQLAKATQSMSELFPDSQTNVVDILSWPGVLRTKETAMDKVSKAMLALLEKTLSEMVGTRRREGEGIKAYLEARLNNIDAHVREINQRMPDVLKKGREKMMGRFEELAVALDKERLEQEMVWLAQKVDIGEELQRLTAHTQEVRRVLSKGGVVGRRLDFLMQELNREANTISSKSVDAQVTQASIELRVQIEQMREQVQNIE